LDVLGFGLEFFGLGLGLGPKSLALVLDLALLFCKSLALAFALNTKFLITSLIVTYNQPFFFFHLTLFDEKKPMSDTLPIFSSIVKVSARLVRSLHNARRFLARHLRNSLLLPRRTSVLFLVQ